MWQKTCHELRLIKASSVTNSPSVDWAAMRLNEHLPPYTGEAFTPTALITLSAQFTYKFLVYHYVLSLRIQVNQSLSLFSLSEWCDVEFHSDSTWSFSLPSWAVILLHKTAKLHVNNASVVPKLQKKRRFFGVIESLRDSIWSFGLCFALTETFTFCSCNGGRNFSAAYGLSRCTTAQRNS